MATRKWGSEYLVNTTTAGDQITPRVAALTGGGYVIVWEDHSGANSAIYAQRFDAQGHAAGAEIIVDGGTGADEDQPSVAGLAGGGFSVTWTENGINNNYILGNVYDAAGTLVRAQPVIFAFSYDYASAVAPLGTGSAVAWQNDVGGTPTIGLRIFDAAGNGGAVLSASNATPSQQTDPSIATAPNQTAIAVVWEDSFNTIQGRLFNAAGAALATQFRVDAAASVSHVYAPVVAWLNNSQFAVAWEQQNTGTNEPDIAVRIFDSLGGAAVARTGNIIANTTTTGDQFSPVIAALPNGGFVIAWTDTSGVGLDGDWCIRLQAFDAAGTKTGGEMVVNTTTTGTQSSPTLTALPDGRIVVAWEDRSATGADTTGAAIRSQIVDPRDGIVTGTPGNDVLYGNNGVSDEISGGAGDDTLSGMGGSDVLYGGDGNDLLDGGKGADDLYGGTGDDTYIVDNVDDTVNENPGEGTDTVHTTLNAYTLGLNVENLGFIGTGNFAGTGNSLNNILSGGSGNDSLSGGAGNDTLIAGLTDTLTGGAGKDVFELSTPGSAATPAAIVIADFIHGTDKIAVRDAGFNLGTAEGKGTAIAKALPATLFSPNTDGTFATAANRFAYNTATGSLSYDPDGNGAAPALSIATLTGHPTLTGADLVYVA